MGYRMKISSALFVVGALSLTGLPPFFGFVSKLNILLSIVENVNVVTVSYLVLAVAMSLVEAAYFFRVIKTLYTRGTSDGRVHENPGLLIPALLLGIVLIALGLFPAQTIGFTKSIAAQLVNRSYYLQAVLGGR